MLLLDFFSNKGNHCTFDLNAKLQVLKAWSFKHVLLELAIFNPSNDLRLCVNQEMWNWNKILKKYANQEPRRAFLTTPDICHPLSEKKSM